MDRRTFLISAGGALGATGLLAAGCTTTRPSAGPDREARRSEIDSAADGTLNRLYSSVRGAQDLGDRALGILVFPRVLSAALGVGGEYGDGVLRMAGGRPQGYYRLVAGSLGLQAGAQSQGIVLMFLSQDALDRFIASKGWTIGADASVSVARIGADGQVDSNTIRQAVVGFAMTNAGLYAGVKLDGGKITRLDSLA